MESELMKAARELAVAQDNMRNAVNREFPVGSTVYAPLPVKLVACEVVEHRRTNPGDMSLAVRTPNGKVVVRQYNLFRKSQE